MALETLLYSPFNELPQLICRAYSMSSQTLSIEVSVSTSIHEKRIFICYLLRSVFPYCCSCVYVLLLTLYLFMCCTSEIVGRVAQSVQRLPTGWTVRGSNPGGARFSAPVQTGPEAHPASCTMGIGSFPGVRCDRGVTLTPHPFQYRGQKQSRATPLLSLRDFVACERVKLTSEIALNFLFRA